MALWLCFCMAYFLLKEKNFEIFNIYWRAQQRETEGRKEINRSKIGASQLGRCRGATDCPEGRRTEKRRVLRGDTELHNTDFKGERMSVKKNTKLHVEKDIKIHEHTYQISIIVKCKFNFSMLQLIFSMSSQP